MATRQNRFLLRRSNVPGNVPSPGQILLGELALNTADVILYASGTTANSILPIGWDRISRTGDTVTGNFVINGGLTANTISATTYLNIPMISGEYLPLSGGTVSGATIFQSGLTANTIYTDYIDFNLTATSPHNEGRLNWNDDSKTLEIDTEVNNFSIEIGQENVVRISNDTGSVLTKGTLVYITGGTTNKPTVSLASMDKEKTSAKTLGFVGHDINNGAEGYVVTYGLLRDINTLAYSAGTSLFLYTGGTWTNIKPKAPDHDVRVGVVIRQDSGAGIIFVTIQNGYELDEMHDVRLSGETLGDLLTYSSYNGKDVWVNTKTLTGDYTVNGDLTITGNTISNSISAVTISATTFYGDGSNLTGISGGTDSYVTGVTISNGTLTLERNNGLPDLTASTIESRSLTFSSNAMALNTATRVTLTPIVMSVTRFNGLGAIDDAGLSFVVPQDYLNTPEFYFTWRAGTTSVNTAKIYLSIYTGDTGNLGSLVTPVETLSTVVTPTTANAFLYSATMSSALNLAGSDSVHVRIYRDPADVNDTFTGDLDMINFVFKYNSKS